MILGTINIEDLQLVFSVTSATEAQLQLRDRITNTEINQPLSCTQLGAILALVVGSDTIGTETDDGELRDALYAIAEPICETLPSELRPIP